MVNNEQLRLDPTLIISRSSLTKIMNNHIIKDLIRDSNGENVEGIAAHCMAVAYCYALPQTLQIVAEVNTKGKRYIESVKGAAMNDVETIQEGLMHLRRSCGNVMARPVRQDGSTYKLVLEFAKIIRESYDVFCESFPDFDELDFRNFTNHYFMYCLESTGINTNKWNVSNIISDNATSYAEKRLSEWAFCKSDTHKKFTQKMIDEFNKQFGNRYDISVDWEQRYKILTGANRLLKTLPEETKAKKKKVEALMRVWVRASYEEYCQRQNRDVIITTSDLATATGFLSTEKSENRYRGMIYAIQKRREGVS